MPIRAHLSEHAAFEPEAIAAMSTAFELVCADLRVFAGDERGREIIATRVHDIKIDRLIDDRFLKKLDKPRRIRLFAALGGLATFSHEC